MKHALLLLGAPLALSAFLVSGRPEAGSATASVKPVKPATPSTPATAIARKAPAEEQAPTPPLRLSDPDGQEMRLEGLSARAAVHGMLSLTELELTFRNGLGILLFECPGCQIPRIRIGLVSGLVCLPIDLHEGLGEHIDLTAHGGIHDLC